MQQEDASQKQKKQHTKPSPSQLPIIPTEITTFPALVRSIVGQVAKHFRLASHNFIIILLCLTITRFFVSSTCGCSTLITHHLHMILDEHLIGIGEQWLMMTFLNITFVLHWSPFFILRSISILRSRASQHQHSWSAYCILHPCITHWHSCQMLSAFLANIILFIFLL